MEDFYCPAGDFSCPYCKEDGRCGMTDEGLNPVLECDDAYYYCGEE